MKKGDIVEVSNASYYNTAVHEGEAELIRLMVDMGERQLWEVHFLTDDSESTFFRWLKTDPEDEQ